MIVSNRYLVFFWTLAVIGILGGCGNVKDNAPTLADIDIEQKNTQRRQLNRERRSQEEIREAYRQYVENAPSRDTSRQVALTRLAQLELELSTSMTKTERADIQSTPTAERSLKRTIELLETTLRDYPNAKGNDKVLYQLAQAYDRSGQYYDSIDRLERLTSKYPRSLYYPEAQFRLAESAFARGDYITAEDAYTEVILTPGSEKFYEKSLFKRGWSRYKQQLYSEAIDDYVEAINFHQFGDYSSLNDADRTQFDEYFRALGLAFSYQSGSERIHSYFVQQPEFKFLYEAYAVVGDIYLSQERFSDAAEIFQEYTRNNRLSRNTPIAEMKIIDAWRAGGFSSKARAAIERYYQSYQPSAAFWSKVADPTVFKQSNDSLRNYIIQVSSYFHERYQDKGRPADFQQARAWYERYLQHYSSHANQDSVYTLFAELLLDGEQNEQALGYFKLAAYDGDIILDKKAAYSTIVLSDTLINSTPQASTQWLDQHLAFAQRFVELYPEDSRSTTIAVGAAERAFRAGRYENTIELANTVPDSADEKTRFNANNLKARSFLSLQQFGDAEAVYMELLDSTLADRKSAATLRDSLALAIYRQAEMAKKAEQTDIALNNYTRIASAAPKSTLAATGLYDAIALSMEGQSWNQAIGLIEAFNTRYPQHELSGDVTKKLSLAYLNADQKGKAAREFERIAQFENNLEVKMAALWRAAELYESKNNIEAAIRAYREYAHTYKTPYEQNMEAMYKLSQLYAKSGDTQRRYFWQTRIRRADQNATKRAKTERTTYIASTTTLDLARQKKQEFRKHRLVEPIAKNLRLKKAAMQDSVTLFGQASSYGIQEITTEATAAIGDIYFEFSTSLLESERPRNLNAEELEQYEILLEDQAFPFEEKAIEFYEANLARTQNNTYDNWIQRSFEQLVALFPVRYERRGKVSVLQP